MSVLVVVPSIRTEWLGLAACVPYCPSWLGRQKRLRALAGSAAGRAAGLRARVMSETAWALGTSVSVLEWLDLALSAEQDSSVQGKQGRDRNMLGTLAAAVLRKRAFQ